MIDTHAHLYDHPHHRLDEIIIEAVDAGVDIIVNTAVSMPTAKTVLEQCGRFPKNLRAALGISPFDTAGLADGWDGELTALLSNQERQATPSPGMAGGRLPPPRTVDTSSALIQHKHPQIAAVGEIGLDSTNPTYPPVDVQMPVFVRQLEIAKNANLPAVIHSRGMEKRAAEICRDAGVKAAVFHCFTGDAKALEYIIDSGYYVSISGIITYKNSHLRELIRSVPVDKLLIETDTPYLSPAPHRGKPNRPALLPRTAQEISRLLNIDEPELLAALKNNTEAAFPDLY